MIIQILVSFFIVVFDFVFAQTTSVICLPGFDWAVNDLQQSPCLVTAYLGHQCSPNNTFNVGALSSGQRYLPPSGRQVNACECSSVYYSLLSACAVCQGSSLDTFTSWTQACPPSMINVGTHVCLLADPGQSTDGHIRYPLTTPNDTAIQSWAFIPLKNDVFDVSAAGKNATGDDSFGQRPEALSIGAIIGLAIGSSITLLLILVAVWAFWRGRITEHHSLPLRSESYSTGQCGIRYDKFEGPPQRPFHFIPRPTAKVVSYRPGLNFDLNNGQIGDLVELSDSNKSSRLHQITTRSGAYSAVDSKTSLESNTRFSRKRGLMRFDAEPLFHPMLPKIFSRAKEVRNQQDARLDLVADGTGPQLGPSSQNPHSDSNSTRDSRVFLDV